MEFNPIFKRESQVRWRSWRPFGLMFCYAMTLACLLGWAYTDTAATDFIGGTAISESGQQIFRSMQILQMTAWLLVVPILAAPLVSAERERGLLEALQLSGLTPARIIRGKLAALVAFALLLMLAVAPVMGVCFMMGGVSPEEFVKSLALQAVTIVLCASAGLFFSARARRSLVAFRNVMIALIACGLCSAYAYDLWKFFCQEIVSLPVIDGDVGEVIAAGLVILNPLRAQTAVFNGFGVYGFPAGTAAASWQFFHPQWVALSMWMLTALVLLRGAARGVKRSFDLGQWIERRRYLSFRRGRPQLVAPPSQETSALPQERTARAVLEMPLAQLVHFRNPVLQREVKGKLRVRRFHKRASVFMLGMAGIGVFAYVWCILWVLIEGRARTGIWVITSMLALLLMSLAVPLMSAGALARERENGTWEMLHLSLMAPRDIIFGKVCAPLVMVAGLFLCAAPVLLPCVQWLKLGAPQVAEDFGPACDYALLTLLVLAASAWCFSAWGLWMSWRCSSTVSAMSLTVVSLLVVLIVVPGLLSWVVSNSGNRDDSWIYSTAIWHPFFAMAALAEPWQSVNDLTGRTVYELVYSPWQALQSAVAIFAIGCVILLDLHRRMNRDRRMAKANE